MKPYLKNIVLLLLVLCTRSAYATGTSDSIYANQNVRGRITVSVDGSITARYDTISPNGHLTLAGQQGVTLQRDVNVQLGGTLIIRTGTPPRIRYTYDASGNRIRREKETQ